MDNQKIADVCGIILKNIIAILVEERKIKINYEKENIFLELADKLIDSCVGLLVLSISKKNKCFSCFF